MKYNSPPNDDEHYEIRFIMWVMHKTYITFFKYDMVYVPAKLAYYVIGGATSLEPGTEIKLKQIAMFKNGVWTDAGQLNTGRRVSFCSYFMFLND